MERPDAREHLRDEALIRGLPADFDQAYLEEGVVGLFASAEHRRELDVLRRLYERWHPAHVPPDGTPRIPLITHQVWMGGELPARYARWRERWIELHPGWEHRLWTDAEIAELDFGSRDLFESTDHMGMKCDLLRAELLKRFGGLYMDTDYRCFRPLDLFHHRYEFFGSLRAFPFLHLVSPDTNGQPSVICSSLMGARPGHPIMTRYLKKVRRLWGRMKGLTASAAERWVGRLGGRNVLPLKHAAKITYFPFHAEVLRYLEANGRQEPALVFPPSYFNPIDWQWFGERRLVPAYWLGLARYALRGGRGWPAHYVELQPHSFTDHVSRAVWAEATPALETV